MLCSSKNREASENLNELVSLKNQVNYVRLQNRLGEQNYHENIRKIYEPFFDTIKKTSEKLTKTITKFSFENNEALKKLNEKFRITESLRYDSTILNFSSS